MPKLTSLQDAPSYYHYFFDLVETDDLLLELEKSKTFTRELFNSISPEKEDFAYQPGKWTTKEILKHIIDCERVYTYRALRFSRFDTTELPGFDEDSYTENLKIQNIHLSLTDLWEEYENLRKSTIYLFKNMTNEMLDFKGKANNLELTARLMGFMTVGHNLHHGNFIKENYL